MAFALGGGQTLGIQNHDRFASEAFEELPGIDFDAMTLELVADGVLLSGVVGMAVAFLVWLHRDRPGAGPLAVFVFAGASGLFRAARRKLIAAGRWSGSF